MSLMIFRVNNLKMTSAGAAIWLQGIKTFVMESSTVIARAQQQQNATATQFDSRLKSSLFADWKNTQERSFKCSNRRIIAQEITLIGYFTIHQLLKWNLERATMSLQGNCRRIEEVYMDWFEDSATQSIITITSNGEVGRPQLSFQMFSGNYKPWSSNFPVPC